MVVIVFLAGAALGALGWERYQLREANSQWSEAVQKANDATQKALDAERRLANAQTKRQREAAQLEATVNDTSLRDCPVPTDVAVMLSTAAGETRAD